MQVAAAHRTPPSSSRRSRPTAASLLAFLGALVPAGLAVFGVAPTPAIAAAAKPRVTFGIQPATHQRPDARPDFDFGVTPGATLSDHVAVLNFSTRPLRLQVYATDAINTATGGFGLLPATTTPTDVGAWISLPSRAATVRVPPKSVHRPGQVIVPFAVHVPTTATPGDHVGGIIASLRTVGKNSTGQNVVLLQRIGTRVFIRVAGQLKPGVTVSGVRGTYNGTLNPVGHGSADVHYVVRNSGNVAVALDGSVSVSGLFGSSRSASVPSVPLLLPGDTLHQTAHLSGVWPEFSAKATVTARPVAPPGAADPGLRPVSASARFWAVPWALIVLIVLVVLLILAAVYYRRRQNSHSNAAGVGTQVTA